MPTNKLIMNKDLKSLSGISEFNFSSIQVKITKNELAHLLGYSVKKIPPPIEAVINNVLEIIPQYIEPKGGFLILSDKKMIIEKDQFFINNTIIQSEKIISRYLQNSDTTGNFSCNNWKQVRKPVEAIYE